MNIAIDQRDHLAVVRVEGKIIRENQGELRAKLEELLSVGVKNIAMDLEKVDYMDSAALGCCACVQKLMRERGLGFLVVFGASPSIQKMWKLIRLDLAVPMFATEQDALEGFAEEAPGA